MNPETLTFDCSGRKLDMPMGGFGIGPDLVPTCGYDDGISIELPPFDRKRMRLKDYQAERELTPAERRELADYVISLWEADAEKGLND